MNCDVYDVYDVAIHSYDDCGVGRRFEETFSY